MNPPSTSVPFRLALGIAALAGFVALGCEMVWYRVLAVLTGGVAASFGLLLAAYLFGLAVGARVSGRFCQDSDDDGKGGARGEPRRTVLVPLAAFVVGANLLALLVVPAFGWSAGFTSYWVGLTMVAIGAAFLGSVLPLVAHFGIEPDDRAGSRLSVLYLANIIGSAAGSMLTGFVLMDRLSLAGVARVLALFGFALGGAVFALSRPSRGQAVGAFAALGGLALGAVLATPLLYDRIYERLVYKKDYDGTQRFDQIVENRSGVIMVTKDGTVYGGGAYDGVLNIDLENNDRNGIVRAYVVGAIHPSPREILVVGLSGGAWTQVVAHLPGVDHVTVVEINPGYVDVVAKHPEVAGILRHPKVSFVVDDGRRWLQRHPDRRFDVIMMNTTLHWRAHATNILSAEFMNIARTRLAPGGIFYFNTTDSLDVALTAAHVFPHVLKIANFIAASDSGFGFDRERWRRILETMTIEGHPILDLGTKSGRRTFDWLLSYNDIAPRSAILEFYTPLAGDVTDDNMRVEWKDPLRYP